SGRGESPHRVLFVTGRLAEPALRRVLADMAPPFEYDVAVLKITVAALMTTPGAAPSLKISVSRLMTTPWIARFLQVPTGTDLVVVPGLCEGDPDVISDKFSVPVD